jgi:hypothetical protein
VPIVEALEVIDVAQGHRERPVVSVAALHLGVQARPEVAVVGQAGEGIPLRALQHLLEATGVAQSCGCVPGDGFEQLQVVRVELVAARLVVDVDDTVGDAVDQERGADARARVVPLVVAPAEASVLLDVGDEKGLRRREDVARDLPANGDARVRTDRSRQAPGQDDPQALLPVQEQDRADLRFEVVEGAIEQPLDHLVDREGGGQIPDRLVENLELGVAPLQLVERYRGCRPRLLLPVGCHSSPLSTSPHRPFPGGA